MITTTSTLPAPVQQSFNMKLLATPVPDLIHKIPAMLLRMPRDGGKIIRSRRYNALPTATVPLGNSGIYPAPVQLAAVDIDAQMNFYGQYIEMNEQVTLQAQDAPLNKAALRLGVSMRQTEDELTRDMLLATASFINCTGANGDNPGSITRPDITTATKALRNANGRYINDYSEGQDKFNTNPVRDAYLALANTNLIGQIDQVDGYVSKWNYPLVAKSYTAEEGAIANVRILLSSIGSISPNASAAGADVYNMFICAQEAFAGVEQDGYSNQFIYRPPIYNGPLALNAEVGYKFADAPHITNDAWVLNLRMTLTV